MSSGIAGQQLTDCASSCFSLVYAAATDKISSVLLKALLAASQVGA